MAELLARDGTWTFDGDLIRIVPGRERGVHQIRQALGEVAVPLAAVAGIAFEPGKKGGRLRLRLRDGADPVTQVARGQLNDGADPYRLSVDPKSTGVAEYFVDEVRNSLLLSQIPDGPADAYLLPGPRVPLTAGAGDGTVTFDGDRVRLAWNWLTEEDKKETGPQEFTVADVSGVEWLPTIGMENGYLRFRLAGASKSPSPKHDPYCLTWGIRREGGTTLLVAAAVAARLPHPYGPGEPAPAPAVEAAPAADHDAMLRRLRELGELHRDGILTNEEFTAAKRKLIDG